MQLTILTKTNYGTMTYYPACEKSKLLAEIAGTKTLTVDTLKKAYALGYRFEFQHQPVELFK